MYIDSTQCVVVIYGRVFKSNGIFSIKNKNIYFHRIATESLVKVCRVTPCIFDYSAMPDDKNNVVRKGTDIDNDFLPRPQGGGITTPVNAPCLVTSTGAVTCIPHMIFRGLCTSNYKRWPYDVQNCTLTFGTWMQKGEEVSFLLAKTRAVYGCTYIICFILTIFFHNFKKTYCR